MISKSNYIFIPSLVICLSLVLFVLEYVHQINFLALNSDQFRWIPLIADLYNGNLILSELWSPHSIHRAPAYISIFLINSYFFDLNMQIEQYLGGISWIILAILIVFCLSRYLKIKCSESNIKFFIISIFIPLIVINSQILPTVLSYSVISTRMIDNCLFILGFVLINGILYNSHSLKKILFICFYLCFATLFFGRGWSQIFLISALLGIFFQLMLSTKLKELLRFSKINIILLTLVILLFIYNFAFSGTTKSLNLDINNIINFSRFYDFSSTFLGRIFTIQFFDINNKTHFSLIKLVGNAIIFLYFFAIAIFIKNKDYKLSVIPIFLILYSLIALCFIYIGRTSNLDNAWQGALFPRHLPEQSIGLAAVFAIIFSSIKKKSIIIFSSIIFLLPFFYIFVVSMTINFKHTIFFNKHSDLRIQTFFNNKDNFSLDDDVKKARCIEKSICNNSRKIIYKFNIMKEARKRVSEE